MKKNTKKIGLSLSLISAILLLSACHKNPLTQHTDAENAKALYQAARAAERSQATPSQIGRTYPNCLSNKAAPIVCPLFLKTMLAALKKEPGYEQATLADIENKQQFARLAEDYKVRVFNTDPYDEALLKRATTNKGANAA